MDIIKRIKKITDISSKLGEIGLIIMENEKEKNNANIISKELEKIALKRVNNYLEAMNYLENNKPFYYLEEAKCLNDLIMEIVAEYKTGIISLMDRTSGTGLKTINFNPNKNYFLLILTRKQIEESGQFFKYIGPIESF